MTRVAAVDIGTNSLRLLVTDLDVAAGTAVEVLRRTTIVRLGQDVDRTGVFAPAALARTFAGLDDYVSLIEESAATAVRVVATSAARNVANPDALVCGVERRLGARPDIVSGLEEARLSYHGATWALVGHAGFDQPFVVLDIGGGSTELVTCGGDPTRVWGESLDVGSVRLTERHLHTDPPTEQQVAAVVADVETALDGMSLPLDRIGDLIGVAGTVTTMAAMVLRLEAYDRDRLHLVRIPTEALLAAVDEMVQLSVADRRSRPFMHPGRADVIGAGALVLGTVVRRLGVASLVVSEHDILDGIAWSLV